MIFLGRTVYLLGAALGMGCILAFVALVGHRGDPLIDAPEYIPWTIAGFVFAMGVIFIAQVMGNDLAPHLPNRHSAPAPRKRRAPPPRGPAKPPPSPEMLAAYHKIQASYDGTTHVPSSEINAAYRTMVREMEKRMTPEERAERDFLRSLDLTAGAMRVEIMPPNTPSDSWIGGLPSLPAGTPWPLIDWKPGLFLAQIALHDLPPETWGGQGPRSGWFVFFMGQKTYEVEVLHTEEIGAVREPVERLTYPRWSAWDNDKTEAALGPYALLPPQWPVRLVPADTPAAAPAGPDRREFFRAFNPTKPLFQPYDWMTLVLMLQSIADTMEAGHRVGDTYRERIPELDRVCAKAEASDARVAPHIAALLSQTRRMAQTEEFSTDLRDEIVGTLSKLAVTRPSFDDGQFMGEGQVPLLHMTRSHDHATLFELHARQLYCADPAYLPEDLRNHMAQVWANIALSEPGHIASDAGLFDAGSSAVLLELPSSNLLGWMFGDASDLAIMIRDKHLVAGDWTQAQVVDNHGI